MGQFDQFSIIHVSREHNNHINVISKLASKKKTGQHKTFIQETLQTPNWDYE